MDFKVLSVFQRNELSCICIQQNEVHYIPKNELYYIPWNESYFIPGNEFKEMVTIWNPFLSGGVLPPSKINWR